MDTHFTYLLLMLGTIAGPFVLSFSRHVQYLKKWKYLPVPIIITMIYFIVWDSIFTYFGIWSFNEQYILGYKILLLPVEEWIFFIAIPFACIFIYECVNYFIKEDYLQKYAYRINIFLIILISFFAILNIGKAYTAFNFISAVIWMLFIQFALKPKWLGRFYIAYLFSLIPFFMVNGVLTYLPVVIYKSSEIIGLRIFSIPVEDTVYCLLLLMMNITIYEWMKKKSY